MPMLQTKKRTILWIIVSVLVLSLLTITIIFALEIDALQKATTSLNNAEYISSSTQRLIKLSLEQRDTSSLMTEISSSTSALQKNIVFGYEDTILALIDSVVNDWAEISVVLTNLPLDVDKIFFAGERHFYHANELSVYISEFIDDISELIYISQLSMLLNIILLCLLISNIFLHTKKEAQLNKDIIDKMFVDTTTGLFDRSKCQELFKDNDFNTKKRSKGIIIFDLNDLKITNDKYGHKIGDELISSFAKIIQDATIVHQKPPFIGRYGGDEFIVNYSDIDQEEILLYLKQLEQLAQKFNQQETKFKISYAVGYSIADEHSAFSNFQELFDDADKKMYENKTEIKKKRQENSSMKI